MSVGMIRACNGVCAMNSRLNRKRRRLATWRWWVAGGLLAPGFPLLGHAQVLSLNVTGPNGEAVGGFRWLIEEDTTKPVTLGGRGFRGRDFPLGFPPAFG